MAPVDFLKFDSVWGNFGFQDEFSCYFCGAPNFNFSDYLIGTVEGTGCLTLQVGMGAIVQRLLKTGGGDQSILCTPTKPTMSVFLRSVNVNTAQ